MTNKPGCPHNWKMLPGYITRYICTYCEVEGEPDPREDKESVRQLPGKPIGWLRRVVNRMREWGRQAAEQGKGASGESDVSQPVFAVSSTLLPQAPTTDE